MNPVIIGILLPLLGTMPAEYAVVLLSLIVSWASLPHLMKLHDEIVTVEGILLNIVFLSVIAVESPVCPVPPASIGVNLFIVPVAMC